MSIKTQNTKTEVNLPTVKEQITKLVKELDGKIDGFSVEILASLELQELQTLADNLKMINKETGTKTRSNVATEVLKHFIDNNLTELPSAEVHDLVRVQNVTNYFDVVGNNEVPKTREAINAFILLKRLVPNNDGTSAERQSQWLKRGKAYTDSHLTGTVNAGSLFRSKGSDFYFIEKNGVITLTPKADEPQADEPKA